MAGIIRAGMSVYGLRGPFVDFVFTGIRLSVDQILENWTGAGALPWTWPVEEQVIDVLHKCVFAITTGYVSLQLCHLGGLQVCLLMSQLCDYWIQ